MKCRFDFWKKVSEGDRIVLSGGPELMFSAVARFHGFLGVFRGPGPKDWSPRERNGPAPKDEFQTICPTGGRERWILSVTRCQTFVHEYQEMFTNRLPGVFGVVRADSLLHGRIVAMVGR